MAFEEANSPNTVLIVSLSLGAFIVCLIIAIILLIVLLCNALRKMKCCSTNNETSIISIDNRTEVSEDAEYTLQLISDKKLHQSQKRLLVYSNAGVKVPVGYNTIDK